MSGETPIVNDASGPETDAGAEAARDVTIEKWVYGGDGLARVPTSATDHTGAAGRGRVLLTPFVLPGERVRVRPAGKLRAELLEVVESARERIEPRCPVFTQCGGCHYQHAPCEFQVARKVEILREQLARVGKIEFDGEIGVVSGPDYGYRNRAQFHVAEGPDGRRRIGYLAARSHDLVPLEGDCPTLSPRLNQALAAMRDRLGDPQWPRFVRAVEIFTNETDIQVNVMESDKPVARRFYDWCESKVAIDYPTASGTFRVSPKSFFQVNRFLLDKLVEEAIGGAGGGSALDLYAGAGLFAVPLSRRFAKVAAVEGSSAAAHDLAFNAQRLGGAERSGNAEGLGNPERLAGSIAVSYSRVEDYLAGLDETPDFVLADPPRAGLGRRVVADLLRLAPRKLTIVSCDPATLARDLGALTGYRLERLALVDLFPQTFHLETVAQLALKP